MSKAGAVPAARIRSELDELSALVERALQGWQRAAKTNDEYYLDGVALNLHGFYSGVERLFEKIASDVDATVPSGANWHRELLDQMSTEVPGVRPAVISAALREQLEPYRGFRHVVRNVYTYRLSPDKMKNLILNLPALHAEVRAALSAFAEFLQQAD